MGVRKNILFMSASERDRFFEALIRMKANIVNPAAPPNDQFSVYDQFTALHWAVFGIGPSPAGPFTNRGHGGPAFLSWHREYIRRFELALQSEVPGVMLPYWDWSPSVFVEALLGPNGGVGGVGGGPVERGYFAYNRPGAPGTPNETFPVPAWWPPSLQGWRTPPGLNDGGAYLDLRRNLGGSPGDVLPTQSDVNAILSVDATDPTSPAQRAIAAGNFRQLLEVGSATVSSHNEVHRYIGGNMNTAASPNDPIFWLHHCNIDRLWAMWQLDEHQGLDWFPISAATGHAAGDAMWPWIDGDAAYVGTGAPPQYIPSYAAEPHVTNQETLDHRALGNAYDTEPVLGVVLDRSYSMVGVTSDPFAGMGATVSKWDLAKLGVRHLLLDCEAAHVAREAYVVGGVQTFTTSGGANAIDPALAAKPYGLIRAGANYPTSYPEVEVTPALDATAPEGNTPIAGALLETEADVVRPPTNALPADDVRYLAILTDGKETSPPWLSSLAAGGFATSVIFAMGLGSGTSWDGVDYASIDAIVSKGLAAPPGVQQVHTGENIGAIDKFFANTVAHAIGFVPMMDPRFELFPGEHVHLPIWITSADEAIMITVLRGDDDPTHWHVALIDPTTRRHEASASEFYHISFHRKGNRDTIFLRQGDRKAPWAGQWALHVQYGHHAGCHESHHGGGSAHGEGGHVHDEPHDDEAAHAPEMHCSVGQMLMPTPWDFVIPVGAPPLATPVFAQFDTPPEKRVSSRLVSHVGRLPAVGGPVLEPGGPVVPSSLVVGVYVKSTLRVAMEPRQPGRFAGHRLKFAISVEDALGGTIRSWALARLVAPGKPVGAAFTDTDTISLAQRKRYIRKSAQGPRFDLVRFLADYEKATPGIFAPRDEELPLHPVSNGYQGEVEDTQVAGVYRAGAYVEGTLHREGGPPERFVRVVTSEVPLGVRLDPVASSAVLHWIGPAHFVVTVSPRDRHGNILSPAELEGELFLFGKRLQADHDNPLDGNHTFTVRVIGSTRPQARAIKEGNAMARATKFPGQRGDVEVPAGKILDLRLAFAGQSIRVTVPEWVAARRTKSAHPAGSDEAMKLPLGERIAFVTLQDAEKAGYKPKSRPRG